MTTSKANVKSTLKIVGGLFYRNFGWKLLSIALAVLVWIAVYREPEMASVLTAPVQFKNSPSDLEISSEIVESVDLETRGPAGLLRNLSDRRVAVVLDFSGVKEPGERTFTIDNKNINLPRGVDLVRIIPSQLRFRFERRTIRRVPVEAQFSGVLPAGFHILKTTVNPAAVAITGPESKVSNVVLLHTDPVDLDHVSDDKTVRVSAYLPNAQLRFEGSPEVTVRVSVGR
jgi:YbbR domain-containing protein